MEIQVERTEEDGFVTEKRNGTGDGPATLDLVFLTANFPSPRTRLHLIELIMDAPEKEFSQRIGVYMARVFHDQNIITLQIDLMPWISTEETPDTAAESWSEPYLDKDLWPYVQIVRETYPLFDFLFWQKPYEQSTTLYFSLEPKGNNELIFSFNLHKPLPSLEVFGVQLVDCLNLQPSVKQ